MVRNSSAVKCAVALALAIGTCSLSSPAWAASGDKARITGLADLAFGTLTMTSDQMLTENICAFSNSATSGYAVLATGDVGGAFALSSGSFTIPYEVRWAGTANQTNGAALMAGVSVSGFISSAGQQTCNSGPASSATLLVTIRAAAAGSARVGSYSGVLTLTITPE